MVNLPGLRSGFQNRMTADQLAEIRKVGRPTGNRPGQAAGHEEIHRWPCAAAGFPPEGLLCSGLPRRGRKLQIRIADTRSPAAEEMIFLCKTCKQSRRSVRRQDGFAASVRVIQAAFRPRSGRCKGRFSGSRQVQPDFVGKVTVAFPVPCRNARETVPLSRRMNFSRPWCPPQGRRNS